MESKQAWKIGIILCVLVNIVVIGVAVYVVAIHPEDQQALAADEKLKALIDSKINDALKDTETDARVFGDQSGDILDTKFLNLLKPMASLHGLQPFRSLDIYGGRTTVRTWIRRDGQTKSHLVNGMKYEHGSIIVPASGKYRVTVHAVMHYEGTRGRCEVSSLEVVRYNALEQKQEVVFQENRTMCLDATEWSTDYLSHIGGLVQLHAEDQIAVVVSNISLLMRYRDGHYFGVDLI
ncbi:uncharacterized protein LOC124125943 isoform X2 [Haliotis rufescens]|nr:uncharacterized protein LOC124125943 isoform X2 [Haliotis rufescens]XP_046345310.2 uncharacterized protein LOC124125943 isoform X2 [Haliotis rufescens]